MRLPDKVALVTGAGGGIGTAVALRFAQEGAIVVAADIEEERTIKLVEEIIDQGGQAQAAAVDVTNLVEVENLVRQVVGQYGSIDILINNAGITRDALTAKMTEEQWNQVLDINLKGTFYCAKAVSDPMIKQNYGKIVNTASVSALGNIGQANYAAAKAGVIGLTKTLALEYARYNINVNCVAPGFTRTSMTESIPNHLKEASLRKIPFRRIGEPWEIASLHLFLASDEAAYITGQVIFIDGGISVGL